MIILTINWNTLLINQILNNFQGSSHCSMVQGIPSYQIDCLWYKKWKISKLIDFNLPAMFICRINRYLLFINKFLEHVNVTNFCREEEQNPKIWSFIFQQLETIFLNDNLLVIIWKGVLFVYQCNDLFFEIFSNLFFSLLLCNVIWSLSIIVCSNDIGTKVNQNLGDFNFSKISSNMKSRPKIKFDYFL